MKTIQLLFNEDGLLKIKQKNMKEHSYLKFKEYLFANETSG